jgi:aminopeptidase
MSDPRLARLGELIVGYSIGLKPGQVIRIDSPSVSTPLAEELYRASLRAGGYPYANVELESLPEILVAEGSGDQLDFVSPVAETEIDSVDAIVTIWAERNTRAFTSAEPARHQRLIAASRQLTNRRWSRISAGELRWTGMLYPTPAHAQDAGMSMDDYEQFVYRACHVDGDGDPVAHWQATQEELARRADQLGRARELRIVGPDTDLRIAVDGRRWEAADGRYNMPDGEVYTSPVETETEGEMRFTFPAVFQGREVDDIRLRFEGGSVVQSEARRGGEFLDALLSMDDGARRLGEVAFGLNYEIDRFTNNTLFDEKIGGTMHVALGSAFKELGGQNESGLHWDLVCDLRAEGEVYADGELVWRAGQFLEAPEREAEPVQR